MSSQKSQYYVEVDNILDACLSANDVVFNHVKNQANVITHLKFPVDMLLQYFHISSTLCVGGSIVLIIPNFNEIAGFKKNMSSRNIIKRQAARFLNTLNFLLVPSDLH